MLYMAHELVAAVGAVSYVQLRFCSSWAPDLFLMLPGVTLIQLHAWRTCIDAAAATPDLLYPTLSSSVHACVVDCLALPFPLAIAVQRHKGSCHLCGSC